MTTPSGVVVVAIGEGALFLGGGGSAGLQPHDITSVTFELQRRPTERVSGSTAARLGETHRVMTRRRRPVNSLDCSEQARAPCPPPPATAPRIRRLISLTRAS